MTESPTPQTDAEADHPLNVHNDFVMAQHFKRPTVNEYVPADFARTLERENIELRAKLAFRDRQYDDLFALAQNDAQRAERAEAAAVEARTQYSDTLLRLSQAEAALRERNVNAERYEWLRSNHGLESHESGKLKLYTLVPLMPIHKNAEFDAAIDAARGKS